MNVVGVYVRRMSTNYLHIAPQNPYISETLCGMKMKPEAWVEMDETTSGVSAHCKPCRDEFREMQPLIPLTEIERSLRGN